MSECMRVNNIDISINNQTIDSVIKMVNGIDECLTERVNEQ